MGQEKERGLWERAVAEVEAGASQAETARRYGVSGSAVGYWVRRLRQERARPAEPQLLPVRLTTTRVGAARCGLVVGDLRFEFEEGTAPTYVAAVVRALRAC
jgi:transposase-like protein